MGRVKYSAIKKITRKLLEENPGLFTTDFEKNKEILNPMIETDKKNRNSIAGYITKLVKKAKQKTE